MPTIHSRAQSGTGKTATFSIAALQKIDIQTRETQVLVLSPTRELATQIQKASRQCLCVRTCVYVLTHMLYNYMCVYEQLASVCVCVCSKQLHVIYACIALGGSGPRWLYECAVSCLHWWYQCGWGYQKTGLWTAYCVWHSWKGVWCVVVDDVRCEDYHRHVSW